MAQAARHTVCLLLLVVGLTCGCAVPAGERSPAQKFIDALSPKPFDDPELEAAMKRGPDRVPDPDADLPGHLSATASPADMRKLQDSIKRQIEAEQIKTQPAPVVHKPPAPPALEPRTLPGVTGPSRPAPPISNE